MERRAGVWLRMIKKIIFATGVFILASNLSVISQASSSVAVPLSDQTYSQISTLIAHGLVKSAIMGARPWSRMEMARLVSEARQSVKKICDEEERDIRCLEDDDYAGHVLKSLEAYFKNELHSLNGKSGPALHLHLMDWAAVSSTYLNNGPRVIPNNLGTGSINSLFEPFTWYRAGRHFVAGDTTALESDHWAQITPFMSFAVMPRFQFNFPQNGDKSAEAFVQEAYGVFQWKNVRLSGGRQSLVLGQGPNGGLLMTDNARPLDQVKLTNDHPFKFPWIFKYIGLNRFTLFMGTLGPETYFKNEMLAGYKWSFKPAPILELGFSNIAQFGGDGAPHMPVGDFFGDYLGFSGTSNGKSNRIIGLDGRLELPFLRGTTWFAEAFFDDKTTQSWKRTLADTAAYYTGIEVPRLNQSGSLYGLLEFKFISEIFYRHSQFQDGYTENQRLIGDPLGPDGREVHLKIGGVLPSQTTRISGNFFYDHSDGNTYAFTGLSSKVSVDTPVEHRFRWIADINHSFGKRYDVSGSVGYERVTNFNNVGSANRNNVLLEAALKIKTDDIFTFGRN